MTTPGLDTLPGALRAFAIELMRITETGHWLDMKARAEASPWFAPPEACHCCGQALHKAGANFTTPMHGAMDAIARLRMCAALKEINK